MKTNAWLVLDAAFVVFFVIRATAGIFLYGPNQILSLGICNATFCYEAWPSTMLVFSGFVLLIMGRAPKIALPAMIFAATFFELTNYAVIFAHLGPNFLVELWIIGILISSYLLWKQGFKIRSTWLFPIYLLVFFSLYFHGYLPPQPIPDVPAETACELFVLAIVWRMWRLSTLFAKKKDFDDGGGDLENESRR